MVRTGSLLSMALAFVTLASPASAQNADDEARMHFRLGSAYFQSGRFTQAAEDFDQAFRLSNRAELLYNIFLARREAQEACPAADELLGPYNDTTGSLLICSTGACPSITSAAADPGLYVIAVDGTSISPAAGAYRLLVTIGPPLP